VLYWLFAPIASAALVSFGGGTLSFQTPNIQINEFAFLTPKLTHLDRCPAITGLYTKSATTLDPKEEPPRPTRRHPAIIPLQEIVGVLHLQIGHIHTPTRPPSTRINPAQAIIDSRSEQTSNRKFGSLS
jgi:hypothetical protein